MNTTVINTLARTTDKGDTIPFAIVTDASGVLRSEGDRFKLACLAFKEAVEKTMRAAGRPVVIRVTRDGIRVLTDSEAARYTAKRFGAHKRGLRRSHGKAAEVNVAHLSADELSEHERNLSNQSRQLQAMRRRALPPLTPVAPAG